MREQLSSCLKAEHGLRFALASQKSEFSSLLAAHGDDCRLIITCPEFFSYVREVSRLPVVTIDASFQDIARAVKLSKNYNIGRCAFIGSSRLCGIAADAAEFLQADLLPVSVDGSDSPSAVISGLARDGIKLVIAAPELCAAAQDLGIANIPLIPGLNSVASAVSSAVSILSALSASDRAAQLSQLALSSLDALVLLLDESRTCIYKSSSDPSYSHVYAAVMSQPGIDHSGKNLIKIGANHWSIETRQIVRKEGNLTHITIKKEPYDFEDSAMRGVMIATHSDLSKHEITESYLDSVGAMHRLAEDARNYARLSSPIIVYGEPGVGKNIFADIIHKHCAYKDSHVVVLDCEQVELPTWTKLLHDSSSVFSENNVVFFFKNIERMPSQIQASMLQFLAHMVASNQNKLVVSCNCGSTLPDTPLFTFLTEQLHASGIFVPPVRSRLDEIENLSSIYINALSLELGSQIIGFENNAVELLKDYDWPGNLNQFRRFIAELMVSSHGYYISRETVLTELKREKECSLYKKADSSDGIDLSGTLEDIEKRIIHRVLKEEKQNQSAAAKRLGISRSTLWRKLS